MAWSSSDRARRLPRDWSARRRQVAERAGYRCEAFLRNGVRCLALGSECDHIQRGDNHELSNLQWLCSWHHKQKTNSESVEARKHRRVKIFEKPHPGLQV